VKRSYWTPFNKLLLARTESREISVNHMHGSGVVITATLPLLVWNMKLSKVFGAVWSGFLLQVTHPSHGRREPARRFWVIWHGVCLDGALFFILPLLHC